MQNGAGLEESSGHGHWPLDSGVEEEGEADHVEVGRGWSGRVLSGCRGGRELSVASRFTCATF